MSKAKNDPGLYRELSKPMPLAEAEQASGAFFEELYELRKKHRIKDLAFVLEINVELEDGQEAPLVMQAHFGSEAKAAPLLAFGLGQAEERAKQEILRLRADGAERMKKR